MTQEDKQLLQKDLCARLPYRVKCSFGVDDAIYEICGINPVCCGASEIQATHIKSGINGDFTINACKPYLFPLSSMTDEQIEEYHNLCSIGTDECGDITYFNTYESIDYLNKNHFDYRGLIDMGLVNDATELNIYLRTSLPNNPRIAIGTKIRSKATPDIILSIISNDCHYDKFECSNGSVLSLKQIEKYYDII